MSRTKIVIALPALNESAILRSTVLAIRDKADNALPGREVVIVIADNGSDDNSESVGRALAAEITNVKYLGLSERGKGRAIRAAWESESADVYAFMDADLSTDLDSLPALIGGIEAGADAAYGTRVQAGSYTERSLFRRIISFGYRALLWIILDTRISDAPCGFKAFSANAVKAEVPLVKNQTWFFDSELILRIERSGGRLAEVPVTWRDIRPSGNASRVQVVKVAREYFNELLRVRRETNSDDFFASNSRLWLAVSTLLIVVTSIPPLFGWWHGQIMGLQFTGRQSFSPGDTAAYLSYIAQARDGVFLLQNMATTEVTIPSPNPIWWLAGQIARLPGVSSLLGFHLLRIAIIPLAVAAFMRSIGWFVRDAGARRAALLLVCFSSGIGALVTATKAIPESSANTLQWPIDLWVAEANVFSSLFYSPHFAASWALLVLALFLINRALERVSIRDAALSGVTALFLFSFHPFYAVAYAVTAMVWLLLWLKRAGLNIQRIKILFLAGLISAPAVGAQAWLAWFTQNGRFMVDSNVLITPAFWYTAAGFGGLLMLALPGIILMSHKSTWDQRRATELLVWASAFLALSYSGISFERRLLEGLQFPLALLSSFAIVWAARWCAARPTILGPVSYAAFSIGTALLFLLTPFEILVRDLGSYAIADTRAYLSSSESMAADWIRNNTARGAAFISDANSGQLILGWGERRVFAGHWAMTPEVDKKSREIYDFYTTKTSAERQTFMRDHGINYVYFGPQEKLIGADIKNDPALIPIFEHDSITILGRR